MNKILLLLAVSLTALSCENSLLENEVQKQPTAKRESLKEWEQGEAPDEICEKYENIITENIQDDSNAERDGIVCSEFPVMGSTEGSAVISYMGQYATVGWYTYKGKLRFFLGEIISQSDAISLCNYWK